MYLPHINYMLGLLNYMLISSFSVTKYKQLKVCSSFLSLQIYKQVF